MPRERRSKYANDAVDNAQLASSLAQKETYQPAPLRQIPITAITATASSNFSAAFAPSKALDGDLYLKGSGKGWVTSSGKMVGEWLQLTYKLNHNKVLACMGDSITAGTPYHSPDPTVYGKLDNPTGCWQYHLQQKLPDWTIINKGVGGGNTTQMVARFDVDIVANNPAFVTILGGINDIATSTANATIQANLQTMYTTALNNGIIPIACTILPYNNGTTAMKDAVDVVNAWIRSYTRDNQIPLIDFFSVFNDPANLRNIPAALHADGIHPSLMGYKLMADTIDINVFKKYRYLKKILISTVIDGTLAGIFMPTKVRIEINGVFKDVTLNALSANKYEGLFDLDVSEMNKETNVVKITIVEGLAHPDGGTATFTGFGEVQLFI
jgi:acyl-CoA thioesterase I